LIIFIEEELVKYFMMQYWHYNHLELEGLENTDSYFEIDNDGGYCRSITNAAGILYSSAMDIEHSSFFLPEARFEEADARYMSKIDQMSFDAIWQKKQASFKKEWEESKRQWKVGTVIKARIVCFYPQGVILFIDSLFYVLVPSYDALKTKIGLANMYPQQEVYVEVIGFDETNNWLLGQP
jgi:ribosomal protein S1